MPKYEKRKRNDLVEAIKLSYPMTMHIPACDNMDGGDDEGHAGDWLVSYPEGGQRFMSDSEFNRLYELKK